MLQNCNRSLFFSLLIFFSLPGLVRRVVRSRGIFPALSRKFALQTLGSFVPLFFLARYFFLPFLK